MSKLANRLLPAALLEVLADGPQIWLVGGALRDHFAQREHPDRDFAVDGEAIQTARQVADQLAGQYYTLDAERDAGRVIWQGHNTLDFVRLRGQSIDADLAARDFTVNALAAPLYSTPELIDPLGGLQDLRDGVLRTCSPGALQDDPIRTLRGVRLAFELGLKMPAETVARTREAATNLAEISAERLRDELAHMLRPASAGALSVAHELGCLLPVLPEVAGDRPTVQKALALVGRLSELLGSFDVERRSENYATAQIGLALGRYRVQLQNYLAQALPGGRSAMQILFLAALHWPLPDAAEAVSRRARRLRFSRREAQWARAVLAHSDPALVLVMDTPVERHRYFESAGAAAVGSVLLSLAIRLADRAGHRDWERRTLAAQGLIELALGEVDLPAPLLSGVHLMNALGIQSGPEVGSLLAQIREAQLAGQIENRAQAIELAHSLLGTPPAGGKLPSREKSQSASAGRSSGTSAGESSRE